MALNRVGPRTVENHNVIHSGGKPPKCVCCKKNSYVFNQIELTQGVTQWRNTDHLLSVWLHLIRSGQSESAQRGPHWRKAFKFFKCVSGVNKFWHFSKIEPNQLSYSALQWCAPCMYYQMPPQMARLRWRITTQVAFEWLFSAVAVCVCLPEKMHNHKSHWLHSCDLPPLCIFKCALNWIA